MTDMFEPDYAAPLREVIDLLTEIRDRLPAPAPAPDNRVRLMGWVLGEPAVPTSADYRVALWFIENQTHVTSTRWATSEQQDQALKIAMDVCGRYRGAV